MLHVHSYVRQSVIIGYKFHVTARSGFPSSTNLTSISVIWLRSMQIFGRQFDFPSWI